MLEALSLAARGWGQVSPNPLVGAVVVQEERVVGRGYHDRYGGRHAEAAALAAAGESARGATLLVNLEPCSHRGNTPPCTEAIIRAGIARVVIGCADPNRVAGGGAEVLRDAGVEVVFDDEPAESIRLNAPFLWNHLQSRPWIELKFALSADEKIAARPGARTRITGPEADAEVQRLRAGFDSILVGSETALVDDPLLTARGRVKPRKPPVRIVLDSRLRLPVDARLVSTAGEAPTWVVTGSSSSSVRRAELERAGVRVLPLTADDGRPSVESVTEALWAEGIRSVLIEGGARTAAEFLRAGLVNRMSLFVSGTAIGDAGVEAFPAGRGEGPWLDVRQEAFGDDTLWELDHAPTLATLIEES